jgi:hypothetical protein
MTKGLVFSGIRGRLKKTGQTTCYHVSDDGDYERGLSQVYTVFTTGQYNLSATVDVAHYAAATISFAAAGPTIADSANLLATFLTDDTIVVKGSASNDGVYTIHAGANAASFVTHEAVINEGAGRYITIYKRTTVPNACVWDRRSGLMWVRNTTVGLKIGPTSNGLLDWYNAANCFTLHPAAGDLQMVMPGDTLRIVGGAGEITRYHVGDRLVCTGFANAANNLASYRVISVTVNGLDLDIVLAPINNVLVAEGAAGARTIAIECRSVFAYCAAAIAASLGGYTDWRVPNNDEMWSLPALEAATGYPNTTAFPTWTVAPLWTSTTRVSNTATAIVVVFSTGIGSADTKTVIASYRAILVRGGAS